jgi:PAS domain S-box-containing protein
MGMVMKKPTYQELQRKVRELEEITNMKVFPHEQYFETLDLHYFRMTRDWHFDFVNGKIVDLTGYDYDEIMNNRISWMDIVYKDDIMQLVDSINKASRSDRYYAVEHRIIRKDGAVRWVRIRGRVFCDIQGDLLFIQGVVNDITQQKYTEQALESEHQVFAWVVDNMEDGIYIVSGDHRIKFMNRTLVSLVGDRVGEVCYQALFGRDEVCPWSVMGDIQQESCGFQEYQLPLVGRVFQVRSFPIKSRDGSIGKLGQLRDITKARKLQDRMVEFETRHQSIVDAANMAGLGIFIVQDFEGREALFRYTNDAFCLITGYTSLELGNMTVMDVVHPLYSKEALDRYRLRRGGEVLNHVYEMKLLRKDGAPITVFFSVAPSSYEGRMATVGFVRDITERKNWQKSLFLSQRLASIGKLAAEIAHEMNNPLTSVLTFSKLLSRISQQEPFPSERVPDLRRAVGFLEGEANRCANIARNLLDFSRQGEIEVRKNDVHQILEKTLAILRHRAELNQIQVVTSWSPSVPHFSCDFNRLQQAFVNILWNCIEAMPDGGILTVATAFTAEPQCIDIVISDTGVGIPEADLERIFEPFFTTKAAGKGVGLGLSVAYGIIRQHRGNIRVESQVGKGTRFTIELHADLGPLVLNGNDVDQEVVI